MSAKLFTRVLPRLLGGTPRRSEASRRFLSHQRIRDFDRAGFASTIRYRPADWGLFFEALLHRSYLPFIEDPAPSNERLEFLGDAVLSFLVAEHLHATHRKMEEGDLTKFRSRLVNRRVLAQCARRLRLTEYLFLSASALRSIEGGSDSILSDGFEAVVGAVYLDGGIPAARKFVREHLLSHEEVLNGAMTDDNYKSALLEFAQRNALGTPKYNIVHEEGPDHDRRFTVEVVVGTDTLGRGTGKSKKDAEQRAASEALQSLKHDGPRSTSSEQKSRQHDS